jgi:ABC-type uncharacterized transport system permease subunit
VIVTESRSVETASAEVGGLRSMVSLYVTLMRTSIINQFQYPVAAYLYMIGMVAEPVIYLVVWGTIAEEQGGSVAGYTPATFAAYYIVWTLVRNINIVFTPYGWEWRIREGELSAQLLKPVHPIHYDLGWFAGALTAASGVVVIVRMYETHPPAAVGEVTAHVRARHRLARLRAGGVRR